MKIKKLKASFGVLQGEQLELGPGLNVVEAPNERGKSTWCAFIRAMIYGVNTSERDKAGHLSVKTKYRPWSGGAMEGTMEVESEGKYITIQRTNLGQSPMKQLDVRYSGTGEEVVSLKNNNLGEALTGVPDKLFDRSAFIRQGGIGVSQTGELEQRISALVSSGEESVSYSDTDNTLRAWLRKRRHNKSGQIPALQEEISQLDRQLDRLREVSGTYGEISLDLDRAVSRTAELAEDLRIHNELEQRARLQKIREAKKSLEDLEGEISSLKKQLDRNGTVISRELISEARESYDQLGSLTINYTEAKGSRESADKDLSLIEEERVSSPFEGCNIEDAREKVRLATLENLEADKAADYKQQKYTIPMAILSVLALSAFVGSIVSRLPLQWLSIAALAGAVAIGVILYKKWKAAKDADKRRTETLLSLGAGSLDALVAELEQYERLCTRSDELREKFEESDRLCEETMGEMQRHKDSFESSVRSFAPEVTDLAEAFQAMSQVGRLVERLYAAERELEAAQLYVKTLTEGFEGDLQAPMSNSHLKAPLRNKAETSYDLKRMEGELQSLKSSYDMAKGEVRALGDPVVLGAKRGELSDRLQELTMQYDALELAVEVLKEADSEIRARFSPLLGKRAGYYIDRLTGGAYKRILFDKDLYPCAERVGESVSRDVLYLSGGTADQIYLALRLAIYDLVIPKEMSCPIILDDALVSFDQERLGYALSLLREIGDDRQVIIFTCQSREGEFFQNDPKAVVVKL